MSKNDITGDNLKSRANNKAFEDNFDRIFRMRECGLCGEKKIPYGVDAMTWIDGKPVCVECGGRVNVNPD
jgi:hypothetical protein